MSPLPEWLNTTAHVAGQVAALPLNILAGLAGMHPQGAEGEWAHPERKEQALKLISPYLPEDEQRQRLEFFRLTPQRQWAELHGAFTQQDQKNAELYSSPQYQDILAKGGPEALRAFGLPQPPQVLAAQDAPLSAESQAQGLGAPSLPQPTPHPILPPIPPEQLVKRFTAETQWDATHRPGAEGRVAASALAKVPPGLEDAAQIVDQMGKLAQSRGYVPSIQVGQGGITATFSLPGQTAEATTRGQKRGELTPLGGGAPARAGGTTGEPTPAGKVYDLGNGQFAREDGALVPAPAAGTAVPAETVPAPAAAGAPSATPMRGQPSLSVENYPGYTAADFTGLEQQQKNAIQLEFEKSKAEIDAKTKAQALNDDERKRFSQIQAARAFLNVFESYGVKGQPGGKGQEAIPSTLPSGRVSGLPALAELGRQSSLVQGMARDPFLQGLRRYQAVAKPILARNLGGDVGNLSQSEQAAIDSVTGAASKPELKDAVSQMRALLDSRESELLAGKTARPEQSKSQAVTPDEARAELRRRGVSVP